MNLVKNIQRIFDNRPRAFLVDEDAGELAKSIETVQSMNIDVDGYTDSNKLLYFLQSAKSHPYRYGVIHENGSKYKPQMLLNFIKMIDPTIQLIIYKDDHQLKSLTENLVLT